MTVIKIVDNIQIPHVLIQPSKGWVPLRTELWNYRELFISLFGGYKGSLQTNRNGVAWAIINPLCQW
jgi:hypothetical protein